ncbi:MAG: Mur ligase domain-containing protein, partial [Clostridia bacterium]
MANYPQIRNFSGKRIHLIGIGGSSMSGLAEMLIDQGFIVSGSDRDEGYLIHHVREKGGEVMIGHRAENVHGADFVVYSAAISRENPERAEAEPRIRRSPLLSVRALSSRSRANSWRSGRRLSDWR